MIRAIFFPDSFTMFFWGVVVFAMAFATASHILMNKREEPVSSVLWIFIVFTFPVAGILLYLIFGINKLFTNEEKMKLATELIRTEKRTPLHEVIRRHLEEQKKYAYRETFEGEYQKYYKMLDRLLPETVPLSGNKIELLIDGTKAYPRMLEEISRAENSIHLQSFIIMDDAVGREIFDLLEKKSKEGVKTKIIYDRFGSFKAGTRFFKVGMENLKIKPFSFFNLNRPAGIQLRNHRKLMVIDGKRAFIGGINISSDNDREFASKDKYIHDLHCFIEGPAVGEFQFSFLNDWLYVSGENISNLFREEYFPEIKTQGQSVVRVVNTGPGQCEHGTEKLFTAAATCAENYIWIITPYFIPDIPFWKMLCAASSRGVEIRLIVPKKNNHWYVQYATENLYPILIDAGVRIFEKTGPFSHAKATLVDGTWAMMGSSNCDVRSFRLNYELDFVASGGDFVEELHSQFMKEMSESQELSYQDVINGKFFHEVLRRACSLLTPIL
ncbi:MAG TPA: cardiolipin synthase [Victivallales bacterium]|nr:cardiolipin synthase [Victivallales bacterium]